MLMRRTSSTVAGITSAASGYSPVRKTFGHFVDQMHVLGLGQVLRAEERLDDQSVQDAHAEAAPVLVVVGGHFGHLRAARGGERGDHPALVAAGAQRDRALALAGFEVFPGGGGEVGPLAGDSGVEAIAQLGDKLVGGERPRRSVALQRRLARRGTAGAWA